MIADGRGRRACLSATNARLEACNAMVSGSWLSSRIAPGFSTSPARGRLAFVYREVLADTDTPVSAYAKLGRGPYSFLLESVVGGDKWAAYSFAGVRPRAVVRARGTAVEILQPADDGGFRVAERVDGRASRCASSTTTWRS